AVVPDERDDQRPDAGDGDAERADDQRREEEADGDVDDVAERIAADVAEDRARAHRVRAQFRTNRPSRDAGLHEGPGVLGREAERRLRQRALDPGELDADEVAVRLTDAARDAGERRERRAAELALELEREDRPDRDRVRDREAEAALAHVAGVRRLDRADLRGRAAVRLDALPADADPLRDAGVLATFEQIDPRGPAGRVRPTPGPHSSL